MKTDIIYLSRNGAEIANRIKNGLKNCRILDSVQPVSERIQSVWEQTDCIICIMASGIVVRSIAGLLKDKYSDPAVVVIDDKGENVISLLSGHLGGANRMTRQIARILKGSPVITTASDVHRKTAVDIWLRENNLICLDRKDVNKLCAEMVENGSLRLFFEFSYPIELPPDIIRVNRKEEADFILTRDKRLRNDNICIFPKDLAIGLGCNRGTPIERVEEVIQSLFDETGLDLSMFNGIGTIDLKIDEKGLLQFAEKYGLTISFYSKTSLNEVKGAGFSKYVFETIGVNGVAEQASMLAAKNGEHDGTLLIRKRKFNDVTVAIAKYEK